MEAYSSSYSSSNSSYLTQNPEKSKGMKHVYPFQSHNSLLHSVRKSPAKTCKKAPVAPMPPTPIKVYKVDAMNFRDLVQQLTSAPEHKPQPQPRQHQLSQSNSARAATSLDVVSRSPMQNESRGDTAAPVCTKWYHDYFQSETFGTKFQGNNDGTMASGLLEMNLSSSPSSYSNWCSFPPMSPNTVTSLEAGKVL
ncbi:uncharacterized protein LOC113859272 [Abrus precatorius]|uniref:Uncharacterized protein LOC113859272 n=1 Tax=Abrus precatorius TaxID=3816 RepID=A0A8B8KZT3_ABRPR|nr:uncharacterized protein LOC113859272 [Abrus precatorius]